jgi:hypothetical protein
MAANSHSPFLFQVIPHRKSSLQAQKSQTVERNVAAVAASNSLPVGRDERAAAALLLWRRLT